MAILTRKKIFRSIEATVKITDFQNIKVGASGEWEVSSGDEFDLSSEVDEITKEQYGDIETNLAKELRSQIMTSLCVLGKGPDVAVKFFEACKSKLNNKKVDENVKEK